MKKTQRNFNYISVTVVAVFFAGVVLLARHCNASRDTFVAIVDGDSVSGLQYEMTKAFADSANLQLIIHRQNDLKRSIKDLLAGRCAVVAIPIPATSEYISRVAFTSPLFEARLMLVQREDSAARMVKKQYELAGDTIYLPANSPHKQRIKNLSNEIADTIFIKEIPNTAPEHLAELVAKGRYRFTACNELLAKSMKNKFPNLDISLPIGFEQAYCWAVHPDSTALLNKLNNFIKTLSKQSTK